MSIIISLDIGTTKICAAAYCTDARNLLGCAAVNNSSAVAGLAHGFSEQSPRVILDCVFAVIRSLAENAAVDLSRVAAIAVTGQMHGVVIVDRKCEPITNLIIWRDTRTAPIAAAIGDKYALSNGCGLRTGYGGAAISWLAAENKLPSDCKALTIADYVCAALCGQVASEPTHAASWGIYDITKSQWNWDLVEELSIPQEVLPGLHPTSKPLGLILPDVADKLGIGRGVVVHSPIGDNQAAVVGATEGASGAAVLNLGTGGQISIPQPDAKYVEGFETRPMHDGSFILVGASLCGGWTYSYLKDFFKASVKEFVGINLDDEAVYAKMNSFLAGKCEDTGLIVSPQFSGTRTDPTLRGAITRIDTSNFTPSQLTNAFACSMVAELAGMVPPMYGDNFSTLIASGNAIRKNPAVIGIAQRCFGKPVKSARLSEEAAVGAAIAAAQE